MKVVSNTSPLINLAWIGRLEILHQLPRWSVVTIKNHTPKYLTIYGNPPPVAGQSPK